MRLGVRILRIYIYISLIMKLLVVLTQYKREHLENQLICIKNQTIQPDYLVVFQMWTRQHEITHILVFFKPNGTYMYDFVFIV